MFFLSFSVILGLRRLWKESRRKLARLSFREGIGECWGGAERDAIAWGGGIASPVIIGWLHWSLKLLWLTSDVPRVPDYLPIALRLVPGSSMPSTRIYALFLLLWKMPCYPASHLGCFLSLKLLPDTLLVRRTDLLQENVWQENVWHI
jgi:hypothetical protein